MSNLNSIRRVIEGTLIIIFSALFIGAGSIVWNAATSYKDDMKAYFEASSDIFSTDISNLSSEIGKLRTEIGQLKDLQKNHTHTYSMELDTKSSTSVIDGLEEDNKIDLLDIPTVISPKNDPLTLRLDTSVAVKENTSIQQIQPEENYQQLEKQSILTRIQQQQQQIQQTKN